MKNHFIAGFLLFLGLAQVSLGGSSETEQLSGNWWNYDSYSMQTEDGPITLTQISPTRLEFFDGDKSPVGHAIKSFGSSTIFLHSSDGLRIGILSQKKNKLVGTYLSYQDSAGIEIAQGFKENTSHGTIYRYRSTDEDSSELLTLEHFADSNKHRFSVKTHHHHSDLDEKLIISRAVFDVLHARRKKASIIGSVTALISLVVIGRFSTTHSVEVNDGSTEEYLRKSRESMKAGTQDMIKSSREKIKKWESKLETNKTQRENLEIDLKPVELEEKTTRAIYDQATKELADARKKKFAIKRGPFGSRKLSDMEYALIILGKADPADVAAQRAAEKAMDGAEKTERR